MGKVAAMILPWLRRPASPGFTLPRGRERKRVLPPAGVADMFFAMAHTQRAEPAF